MNDFWGAAKELSPNLFLTYAVIDNLSTNGVGYCFSKNESISEKINKHPRSISRDISELIKLEYIYVIEIKYGFVVLERRLYTEKSYKKYIEDKENIENLLKTFYVKKDDITYYYNEKNPHPKFHSDRNTTNHKIVTGANHKIENGAEDKSVNYNLYNNNLTNITEITEEPVPVVDKILSKTEKIKLILNIEKIQLDFKFIKELSKKYDFETIVDLIKSVDKDAESHGAYLRGIIKNKKPQTYIQKQKETAKKIEIKVHEEPKERKTREDIINEFCLEIKCSKENIPNDMKKILNTVLEGMGYERHL